MANVKNILYVHGLGGSKESTTCKNLHEILRDCTIFADDFDLFDVAGTQKKIENLESEQAATIREKQELQKKQKTLEIIQQNFSVLLDAPEMQSIEKHESIL